MMSNPLVSVIIPVYNGALYLREALASIFAQDYRPFEVIVVDDGSTDESAAIAQSFDAVQYHAQSHRGIAAARNYALTFAQGEYVAFLDQDDLWSSHKLSLQVSYMEEHPDVGIVLANERMFLTPGFRMPYWLRQDYLDEDHTGCLPGTWVVRRSVFARVGNFKSVYTIADDFDWFLRAKDAGIPFEVLSETLLLKRVHPANHSSNLKVGQAELLKVLKESIDRKHARAAKN
jgi:glycosyltransferase involved in cell wall biosynthesis